MAEKTAEIGGERTRKMLAMIDANGIKVGDFHLTKEEVVEKFKEFFNEDRGMRRIPSGELRLSAIKDVIEETRKARLQNSKRYLEDTFGANPVGASIEFSSITGEIGEYRPNILKQALSKVSGSASRSLAEDSLNDKASRQKVEVGFSRAGQVQSVTFLNYENGVPDERKVVEGMTKSQVMFMTAIAEYNMDVMTRSSTLLLQPVPHINIGSAQQPIQRSENFYQALKTK
jgi:hypothetical protein